MGEYVTLMGVEDIRRSASEMTRAATEISKASANIESSLHRHQIFLSEWIGQFEVVLEKIKSKD